MKDKYYSNPVTQDFKLFLYLIWKHLNLPTPTRSQFVMADWLQSDCDKLVISAFRGVGKSWVTAAFTCWLLLRDPQFNILVVSASKSRADDFSTFVLRLIHEVPILQHLIPRDNQRSSKIAFDVAPARANQSPSVKSVGITGQLTGSRAHVIIADDIEVMGNSATQGMRDKLKELTKEFTAIVHPDVKDKQTGKTTYSSKIIYLGTPQTEQSIYNALPERGYEIRIIPALYPTPAQTSRYGSRLGQFIVDDLEQNPHLAGQPVCTRFSEHTLLEKLSEYGKAGFALQFMLDTSLADTDRYPLKLHDLIVMDLDIKRAPIELSWSNDRAAIVENIPSVGFDGDRFYKPFMVSKDDWQPYQGCIMAIDPSGRGGDETTWVIVANLNGRLFLLDSGGDRRGYEEEVLEMLANRAKLYGVNKIIVEPNFGDGMFNKLLQPVMTRIYPCTIEDSERAKSQKESRIIDTLEPVLNQHRLIVDRSLIERDFKSTQSYIPEHQNRYRLFYQLTRITRERGSLIKDDRVDALAIAVHYWSTALSRDRDKATQQTRQKLIDAHLQNFLKHAIGGTRIKTPSTIIPQII